MIQNSSNLILNYWREREDSLIREILMSCYDQKDKKENKMKIDDFIPPHHELTITSNGHRVNYESVSSYLEKCGSGWKREIDPEDLKECIEKDTIWEVQLYPRTPSSFYWTAAATLDKALELMWKIYNEEKNGI